MQKVCSGVEGLASAMRINEKLELYAESVVMGEVKGLASALGIIDELELYAETAAAVYKERIGTIR